MENIRKLDRLKRIALVAHDHKKADLVSWAIYNKATLAWHQLFSTGTTGTMIEQALGRPVNKLLSGPLGGDQQIGAMIAEGKIDILIFFWDPMESQPHDSDVKALQRMCVAWNIPMACNRATADYLMTSPFMHDAYDAIVPDYGGYLKRPIS
jgi:methylglyoxal synthase